MNLKKWINPFITAWVLGLCLVMGYCAESRKYFRINNPLMVASLIGIVFVLTFFLYFGRIIWDKKFVIKGKELTRFNSLLFFFLLFSAYSIVLLATFPGLYAYDAETEWEMVRTGMITNHHPVLHVLLVGWILEISNRIFASINPGVFVYCILQMGIVSLTFTYFLKKMYLYHVKRWIIIFAFLMMAFMPSISLFTISLAKDAFFNCCLLLFCLSVFEYFYEGRSFDTPGRQIRFVLSAVGTMLMRNNGKFVVIPMLLILLVNELKQKSGKNKKMIFSLGEVIGIYLIYYLIVFVVIGIPKGESREMISVPINQLARVYTYEYTNLPLEEKEDFYRYGDEKMWVSYQEGSADFVKTSFNDAAYDEEPVAFYKLWLKYLIRYPHDYFDAFFGMTCDYLYPFGVVDGYRYVEESAYTSYFIYAIGEPAKYVEIFPHLHKLYEFISLARNIRNIPFYFLVLNPGVYLFICILALGNYVRKNKRAAVFGILPVFWLMASVMFGPMALVRYVLILWYYTFAMIPLGIADKTENVT